MRIRILCAAVAALTIASGVPAAHTAAAPPVKQTGLSGRVTDTAGTPIAGVAVSGVHASTGVWGAGFTDADGRYTVTLDIGQTTVCFNAYGTGYESRCYKDVPYDAPTSTLVTVKRNRITSGINQTLPGANLGIGSISGRVTGADRLPIEGVRVEVRDAAFQDLTVTTGADGSYLVSGVTEGDATVCFNTAGSGWEPGCYKDAPYSGTPTAVHVSAGATTTGIDQTLSGGAEITGEIAGAGGGPWIEAVKADLYSLDGKLLQSVGTYWTGHGYWPGHYRFQGLAAGSYKVCFDTPYTGRAAVYMPYRRECFDNVATPAEAAPVSVTRGQLLTLNATLALATGSVSGRVTDAQGNPRAGASVWVEYLAPESAFVGGATVADGSYTIGQLRTGDVQVCTTSSAGNVCTGTLHVEDGQALTGINLVVQ